MEFSTFRYIIEEIKIRFWWTICCFFLTFLTCYYFSEDLFFGLATPYFKVSKVSFFICTQITESLNTYLMNSIILGLFFSAPYVFYQFWCFIIPSCTESQRFLSKKILTLSFILFLVFSVFTFIWLLPNIWLFLYQLSNTTNNSQFFVIQLQPRVYDFSLLTLRVLFFAGLCSQIPIIVISSIEYNLISIQNFVQSRRFLWFTSILLAALITPPDLWCQLSAWFSILILIEFAFFVAILQSQYSSECKKT